MSITEGDANTAGVDVTFSDTEDDDEEDDASVNLGKNKGIAPSAEFVIPPGFTTDIDPASGYKFYVNEATGAQGWTLEEVLSEEGEQEEKFPAGVQSGIDPTSGDTYYCNTYTGVLGWSIQEVWTDPNSKRASKDPKTFICSNPMARPSRTSRLTPTSTPGSTPGSTPAVVAKKTAVVSPVATPAVVKAAPKAGAVVWPAEQAKYANVMSDGTRIRVGGVLMKRGSGESLLGRKNWQYRYFKLDPSRHVIKYYEDPQMKKEKGCIRFGGATSVRKRKPKNKLKGVYEDDVFFAINLIFDGKSGKPKKGSLELRAPNSETSEEWEKAIRHVVASMTKKTWEKHQKAVNVANFLEASKNAPPRPPPTSSASWGPPNVARGSKPGMPPGKPMPPMPPPPTFPKPTELKKPPALPPMPPKPPPVPPLPSAPPPLPSAPPPPPPPPPPPLEAPKAKSPVAKSEPPPPPPPPLVPKAKSPLAKYERMVTLKLPRAAIEAKMQAEGVTPSALFEKPANLDAALAKYQKMLKVHIPEMVVALKMQAAGLDPALLKLDVNGPMP